MGDVIALRVEHSPLHRYLASLDSPLSRSTMATCALALQAIVGKALHLCTPGDLGTIKRTLGAKYEPATSNKHLSALRGVLKCAYRMGQVSEATMRELPELHNFRGTRLPAGRMLSPEEIAGMLALCSQEEPLGARDGAMLALLRVGLRRKEVVTLDLCDLDLSGCGMVKVRGKGDKERLVPLSEGGRLLMLKWLAHRGQAPGPLLVNTITLAELGRLHDGTIDVRIKDLWARGGDQTKARPSPHDMRRTMATELIVAGANLDAVQTLMGHSKIETTLRYSRQPEEQKREAMKLLSPMNATKTEALP